MRILGVVSSSSREVPGAPTIGTATDIGTARAFNNGAATVSFTAPTWDGGLPITGYTVTSNPGGFTASGASSPLTVTGLQSGTSYTFTVVATNSRGNSAASAASNSITATTVPQAPTIGTATAGDASATVTYTANATGGKTVSTYTATSSPGSLTGTGSSPITVSGLTNGTAYTFTVTATNANGTSTASAASNSVTPVVPTSYDSIASYTFTAPTYGSTFTFSSIPQTYKHLQLRIFSANTDGAVNTLQYLTVSGNNTVRSHWLRTQDGSSVTASTNGTVCYIGLQPANFTTTQSARPRAITIVDIHDYTSTTKYKTYRSISGFDSNGNSSFGQEIGLYSGFWFANTNAITSLTYVTNNDLTPGTVVALYGIKG